MSHTSLNVKVSFSLLSGLPASGKSAISKFILEAIKLSNVDLIILPVPFDDLLPLPISFDLQTSNSNIESLPKVNTDVVVWKRIREHIRFAIIFLMKICVNSYNNHLELGEIPMSDFIQSFLQSDLNKAESDFPMGNIDLDLICKILLSIIKSFSNIFTEFKISEGFTCVSSIEFVKAFIKWHHLLLESSSFKFGTLILLDDNFFYGSMRHEYYKIARTCTYSYSYTYFRYHRYMSIQYYLLILDGLGFSIIYLDAPVELCIFRNRERAASSPRVAVSEDTIRRMHQVFEAPIGSSARPFERHVLRIDAEHLSQESLLQYFFISEYL